MKGYQRLNGKKWLGGERIQGYGRIRGGHQEVGRMYIIRGGSWCVRGMEIVTNTGKHTHTHTNNVK